MTDAFQVRYEAHQKRKAGVLAQVLEDRHSTRRFSPEPVGDEAMSLVVRAIETAPSSCDRRGVRHQLVCDRDRKALLGGLLVGGTGWVHRAPVVVLLHADESAYKAPGELEYMPYLDAGVVVGQVYLAAQAVGLKVCYVNPQVRDFNKHHFAGVFGPGVYCGAIALGWPHPDDYSEELPPLWVLETS